MYRRLVFLLGSHAIHGRIGALGVIAGASLVSLGGAIFAATTATDLTPWTNLGSSGAAFATLIWVVRQSVAGRVVAAPIDDWMRDSIDREALWLAQHREEIDASTEARRQSSDLNRQLMELLSRDRR